MRVIRSDKVYEVLDIREDDFLGEPYYELLLGGVHADAPRWTLATYCRPLESQL
jgi:hypothetical protein